MSRSETQGHHNNKVISKSLNRMYRMLPGPELYDDNQQSSVSHLYSLS